ncbi:uncharacterized protein LOC127129411 [Lathyrus oleraceus]|uniref:uncharacterized protein LOC127129411 n=1 Tax=Pisum sativum TaxID=3888 RepID=UPI0021D39346|nr:uncharacterized protein LOC127129411 [Pisum sativum]
MVNSFLVSRVGAKVVPRGIRPAMEVTSNKVGVNMPQERCYPRLQYSRVVSHNIKKGLYWHGRRWRLILQDNQVKIPLNVNEDQIRLKFDRLLNVNPALEVLIEGPKEEAIQNLTQEAETLFVDIDLNNVTVVHCIGGTAPILGVDGEAIDVNPPVTGGGGDDDDIPRFDAVDEGNANADPPFGDASHVEALAKILSANLTASLTRSLGKILTTTLEKSLEDKDLIQKILECFYARITTMLNEEVNKSNAIANSQMQRIEEALVSLDRKIQGIEIQKEKDKE